jgi:transposase
MNVTVECADAKVVAETLQMRSKVAQSEMKSLRHQLDVLQAAAGRVRSFSDVSGGSQLAATLHLSEQLESDTEPVVMRTSETTEALLQEISRLTDMIEIKDEAIRLMHLQLLEAKKVDTTVLDESRGWNTGLGLSRGSRVDGTESQYKELFASSEAEMSRLKVTRWL